MFSRRLAGYSWEINATTLSVTKFCLTLYDPMDSAANQAPLYSTISQNLLKFMSIESVILSNHSSSAAPIFFCLQSLPASEPFPVSWLLSGYQSIGVSVSETVLPVNIQGWFPLELTALISLLSKVLSKSLLQHNNLKASILRCSAFFMVQLSHPYVTAGKTLCVYCVCVCVLYVCILYH